ncbi:MAG: sigma-70 family RNA polymerase sigma factor [Candidatus Dormibacteria bacterium]
MSGGVGIRLGTARDRPEEADLGAAFSRHRSELLGYARRRLADPDLAEEAVQETFVRALRARDRFDPDRGRVRAWLFAIERRVVVDLARARQSHATSELGAVEPVQEDSAESLLQAWQVEAALAQLTQEHRQVIVEIYYRGRSAHELAGRLKLAEGTVRSRLYYGLRQLRAQLEARGWEP